MLFSYLIIGLSQLICIRATTLAAQDQFPSNMVLTAPGKKDYTSASDAFEVTCDGDVYGHDLRYESCAQLLKDKDGRLTGPQTFGRRESPAGRQATYPTPWRWSSGKSCFPLFLLFVIACRPPKDHILLNPRVRTPQTERPGIRRSRAFEQTMT